MIVTSSLVTWALAYFDIRMVFWNGSVNWALAYFDKLFLVSFDIETHNVKETLIPSNTLIDHATSINMSESQEDMSVSCD